MNSAPREHRVTKASFTSLAWVFVLMGAIGYVRYEQVDNIALLNSQTAKVEESTKYRECVERRRIDYIQSQIDLDEKYAHETVKARLHRRVQNLQQFKKVVC